MFHYNSVRVLLQHLITFTAVNTTTLDFLTRQFFPRITPAYDGFSKVNFTMLLEQCVFSLI